MIRKLLFLSVVGLFLTAFTFELSAQTNILVGSNMENAGDWSVSYLNTGAGDEPTGNWNHTTNVPTDGTGGCLNIVNAVSGSGVQYCIYQAVDLHVDSIYYFDAAYRDFSVGMNDYWCEVFIGDMPVDGADYGTGNGEKILEMNTWWCSPSTLDGTLAASACNYKSYVPATTGTYYIVLKMGTLGTPFEVSIDELSLTKNRIKPLANFSSDKNIGLAPFTVQFNSATTFASSWAWTFGDGNTSVLENPSHTYTATGSYDVQLTASNEIGDSVISKTAFIKVIDTPLPPNELLYGGNMEDESFWNAYYLEAVLTAEWNHTTNVPTDGAGGCLNIVSSGGYGQYIIYQAVELHVDSIYHFDAAYKDFAGMNDYWCEAFIGEAPVVGNDYGTDNGDKILEMNTWWCSPVGTDGMLSDLACNYTGFVPPSTGTYYLVFKMGSSGGPFDVSVDELSLKKSRHPVAQFSADKTSGFAPLAVQFTDESKLATGWSWNFGDGNTSTEVSPSHTYIDAGTYSVTLTSTNEVGDSVLTKTDYIVVNEATFLTGGGNLLGGNMESETPWTVTYLNNASGDPVGTWAHTTNVPTAGQNGCLNIVNSVSGSLAQYCIYQAVTLDSDSIYYFDGAYKDFSGMADYWCEVFIGIEPTPGSDYGTNDGDIIAKFHTWDPNCDPNGLDGTFASDACEYAGFIPPADGTYYFVFKMGSNNTPFEVSIDELSLRGKVVVQAEFFISTATTGDAPLTVSFMDNSIGATEWNWDFGDTNTSTDQHPTHIYTVPGTYTVSLTAINGDQSDIDEQIDAVVVTGSSSIETALLNRVKIFPSPSTGQVNISGTDVINYKISVLDISGKEINYQELSKSQNNLTIELSNSGVYFIKIISEKGVATKKLIIEK